MKRIQIVVETDKDLKCVLKLLNETKFDTERPVCYWVENPRVTRTN